MNKKYKRAVNHGVTVQIDRKKFDNIKGDKSDKEFHKELIHQYSLDLQYASFNNLLLNKNNWLAVYAMCVANKLGVNTEDIFDIFRVIPNDNNSKNKIKYNEN